jgi:hypothetical protein
MGAGFRCVEADETHPTPLPIDRIPIDYCRLCAGVARLTTIDFDAWHLVEVERKHGDDCRCGHEPRNHGNAERWPPSIDA